MPPYALHASYGKMAFQRGMSLRGGTPLFAGIAGNADHSDLAV
jgi:hypothetical protein